MTTTPNTQPRSLRVSVLFECSGTVREAFRALGHDARSMDLKAAEDGSPHHDVGDAFSRTDWAQWDIVIAHPPCTYLCSSGLHWNHRVPGRKQQTEAALGLVRALLALPIRRLAMENPAGRIETAIGPATQYVQPWEFGDDASKKTGLWLRGLPALRAHYWQYVAPRLVCVCDTSWRLAEPGVGRLACPTCGRPSAAAKRRWANQTDSGQNRLAPGPQRAADRARTYPGIAAAMAEQWSAAVLAEQ